MIISNNPCSSQSVLISNASVVTPNAVLENACVWIENGKFLKISQNPRALAESMVPDIEIDAEGYYLMPGIIDLHSDKLESEITPRPGADLPTGVALQEIEQKFLACGVTTIFHAISLGYLASEYAKNSAVTREEMCYATHEFATTKSIARTHVHLRYEIQGHDLDKVYKAIDEKIVDLLSVMDHRPGHGQMSKERCLKNLQKRGLPEDLALKKYEEMHNEKIMSVEEIRKLVDHAHANGLYVASHDDPSAERVIEMNEMGINIAEFPLTLEAAEKAIELGMTTIGGSANSLRGGSLSGNMCVNAALEKNLITSMCSDYYPPALIHSVFKLYNDGKMSLPESIALVTSGPAKIVGLADVLGTIEEGKLADFLIVDGSGDLPKVLQSWVGGKVVHQSTERNRHKSYPVETIYNLVRNEI